VSLHLLQAHSCRSTQQILRADILRAVFFGPIPGNIQEQVGQGSEQPDLVSGVPARCRGVGLDDL